MSSIIAVVVAGGKGERMEADIRKQYLTLDGIPILSRTLFAFFAISLIDRIYLVIPESDFDFCRQRILSHITGKPPVHLVAGGVSRQESVNNGLSAISDTTGIVLIHDGVRPFVPVRPTEAAIGYARQEGACILGVSAVDTLKQVDDDGYINQTLPRSGIWQAQTPQVFEYRLIKKAHDHALSTGYIGTDDASLVEHLGCRVKMIYGDPHNIKITKPEDMALALSILKNDRLTQNSQKTQ